MTTTPSSRAPQECSGCNRKHWTITEVLACRAHGDANVAVPMVTERQLDYIRDLNGDTTYAAKLTRKVASDYIDALKVKRDEARRKAVQMQQAVTAPPGLDSTWPFRIPRAMVEQARSGRYAVDPESDGNLMFVRISRPSYGNRKGAIVIQTQHSERYSVRCIIWPSGNVGVYNGGQRIDAALTLAVCDPVTSAMRYGIALGVCCRCGKELTDQRSRYYGIGPECEKHFPEIITRVNDDKGEFIG